jgi:hypothetical protein
MTGSWLIVKLVGIAVLCVYLVLMLVAIYRFRTKLTGLQSAVYLPLIFGNFIGLCVPSVFENVAVTRVCFVVAHAIYLVGILILVRGLAQKDQILLKQS